MGDLVNYSVEDDVATVELTRPDKKNALTIEMWNHIAEYVEEGENDARVIELTAHGNVFCAGDDINALQQIEDEEDVRQLSDAILDCFAAIEGARVPIIGNPQGSAYGGGFELLLAADLTVAPEGTTFALPEAQIGAYPFYGAKRLSRMIGRQRAMLLTLTGREIPASTAVEWGLFALTAPSDEIKSTVDDLIADLLQASPSAIETTKAWLNSGLRFAGEDEGMRTGLGYLFAGPGAHEGAQAFLENRTPDYSK